MPRPGKQFDKRIVDSVLNKCWDFLNRNFENFSTANKVKIALHLGAKSMPNINLNENTGEITFTHKVEKVELEKLEEQLIGERNRCSLN